METYKKNHPQVLYNLILYSLTSMVTFLFFSYPFWLPSVTQCLYSLPKSISIFFDAKFLFILVNIIVLILIGESRLTRPCSSQEPEIYDQFVERSRIPCARTFNNNFIANEKEEGFVQNINIRGNLNHEEMSIKEIEVPSTSVCQDKMKQSVIRGSKSEVWHKSGELMKTKPHDGKLFHGKKDGNGNRMSNEEIRKCERNYKNLRHEGKLCMSNDMSDYYPGNIIRGLKASKSEVWGQSEKVETERAKEEKVEQLCMPNEELNTRVEAFIAKVNKQRLLEAKLLRNGRGY